MLGGKGKPTELAQRDSLRILSSDDTRPEFGGDRPCYFGPPYWGTNLQPPQALDVLWNGHLFLGCCWASINSSIVVSVVMELRWWKA
jgi:hypothetical protein